MEIQNEGNAYWFKLNDRTEYMEIRPVLDAPHRLGVYQQSTVNGEPGYQKLLKSDIASRQGGLYAFAEEMMEKLYKHYSRQNI